MPVPLTPAPTSVRAPTPAPGRTTPAAWWIVLVLASLVGLYALAYVVVGDALYPPPLADSFRARPWGIYPHALFGAVALLLGPLQFRRDLLLRRRPLHRTLGKAYVVSCLLTGSAGLYMAAFAFGGWANRLGFAALGACLLASTLRAYAAVRNGDLVGHRQWMLRSYSLIFAAVTLRLQLPLLMAALDAFEPAYAAVAWLSWVPNLIWAEWYVRRSAARETPLVLQLRRT